MATTDFKTQNTITTKEGVNIRPMNSILDFGFWYISYAADMFETAIVIGAADTLPIMCIVLKGNHKKKFIEICEQFSPENNKYAPGFDGRLGECIRYACNSESLLPERSTIGSWNTRMDFREITRTKLN